MQAGGKLSVKCHQLCKFRFSLPEDSEGLQEAWLFFHSIPLSIPLTPWTWTGCQSITGQALLFIKKNIGKRQAGMMMSGELWQQREKNLNAEEPSRQGRVHVFIHKVKVQVPRFSEGLRLRVQVLG